MNEIEIAQLKVRDTKIVLDFAKEALALREKNVLENEAKFAQAEKELHNAIDNVKYGDTVAINELRNGEMGVIVKFGNLKEWDASDKLIQRIGDQIVHIGHTTHWNNLFPTNTSSAKYNEIRVKRVSVVYLPQYHQTIVLPNNGI